MYIKTVKVGRVFNLGNFQTERVEVEIELTQEESPELAYITATAFISKNNEAAILRAERDRRSRRPIQEWNEPADRPLRYGEPEPTPQPPEPGDLPF